jgi:hypothetical protein
MFGSTILEVAIGLAFLYMILSLIVTSLTELISQIFALRSANLRRGIQTILADVNDTGLTKQFYEHPLIKSLAWQGFSLNRSRPSYIPSHSFVMVLFDLIRNGPNSPQFKTLTDLEALVRDLKDNPLLSEDVRKQLNVLFDTAADIYEARLLVENWFNDTMSRISGWYKRRIQLVTLLISLVVTFAANADSIFLFNRLNADASTRQVIVASAERAVQSGLPQVPTGDAERTPDVEGTVNFIAGLQTEFSDLFQIIGWASPAFPDCDNVSLGQNSNTESLTVVGEGGQITTEQLDSRVFPCNPTLQITRIIGWLLTAIAISLGAPFWFDMLNKLVNLRTSTQPKATTGTAEKKDSDEGGGGTVTLSVQAVPAPTPPAQPPTQPPGGVG